MSISLVINKQDVAPLLSAAPRITDDIEASCRTLDFQLQAADGLVNYLGQQVELFIGDKREFFGFLEVRGWEIKGAITYKVYDPLYFLAKNPDDYYFTGGLTASQRAAEVLKNVGVVQGKLAPTGVVLPASLYKKAEGDKVIIDGLVKTVRGGGKKYWLRFNPYEGPDFGATIFERVLPKEIWAFQRGVNMTNATYSESLEEHYNVVKLVNRETGKTVVKYAEKAIKDFGARTRFEEVDKDSAGTMDTDAAAMLTEGKVVKTSISIEGVNDGLVMPIFHVGDVIYADDDLTQAVGAYYIRRVEHTFISSRRILLAMDVEAAPSVPPAPFDSAEKDYIDDKAPKKQKKQKATADGKGVSENPAYNAEMKGLIDKYGLDSKK
jgi:hypothetical protein